MKPCAHLEALESYALRDARTDRDGRGVVYAGDGGDAGDSWLEAHVGECASCSADLDRLLDERALFVRRARAVESPLDPSGVFAELGRRRERFRKSGTLASLVAAAAACVAMAFAAPGTVPGRRAVAEPADVERGALASWDDAPMTMSVAACMPRDVVPYGGRSACDVPATTSGSGEVAAMTSGGASWWSVACVPDVTCSVARP